MLISKQWLSDFIALDDVSDERLEELITTRVAEIDDLHTIGAPLKKAVVAQVASVKPHSSRDGLLVCEVQTGSETVTVVCGAPNVTEGMHVAYVPPGGVASCPSMNRAVLVPQ